MTIPTIQQYKNAITQVLLPRQIEALQILYEFPNSSATAIELTYEVDPGRHSRSITSFRIGKIGKRISDFCGIIPKTYLIGSKERPAYSTFISESYRPKIGWTMNENLKKAMEELNLASMQNNILYDRLPTETLSFDETLLFTEGKIMKVFVNKYERNLKARNACIRHYGNKCCVCQFDFGEIYGKQVEGFIQVHHVVSLSEIGKEYPVDPIRDLRPLCPNCHSVVHLSKPSLTIEELKDLMDKSGK